MGTDINITFPSEFDTLPEVTEITPATGEVLNAFRESILNIERVLGLDVNIGLYSPDPEISTVDDRIDILERGLAERNLIFREINISDAFIVRLLSNNQPTIIIGKGNAGETVSTVIRGPLTILEPQVSAPRTIIQTPISLMRINDIASTSILFKGQPNLEEPLLTIEDTRESADISADADKLALKIKGNVYIEGILTADYSISHKRLLDTSTVPTKSTRGSAIHVTQGDYHSHRKGRFDEDNQRWIVDSGVDSEDFGIISHRDMVDIGTRSTDGNDFVPIAGVPYHITGGDEHRHKNGDGAAIDHNDLLNINPKFSNHTTNGDSHKHSAGDGGQIAHSDLSGTLTTGDGAIHTDRGSDHQHQKDEEGEPVGDGGILNHIHFNGIETTGEGAVHVTNGDAHAHTDDGDGGKIDHLNLSNNGTLTHLQIESRLGGYRNQQAGVGQFSVDETEEVTIQHTLGTSTYSAQITLTDVNGAPPPRIEDIGVLYISEKTSSSFKVKRIGGAGTFLEAITNPFIESFTAGAGQTVFDLAESYFVGSNSLAVYASGLRQRIDVDYQETSSTRVTFLSPSPFVGGENVIFEVPAGFVASSAEATHAYVTTTYEDDLFPLAVDTDLRFTARLAGSSGNSIQVQYDIKAPGGSIVFTVSDNLIKMDIPQDKTAVDLAIAAESNSVVNSLIFVTLATDSNGTGDFSDLVLGLSPLFQLEGGNDAITAFSFDWAIITI